MYNRATKTEMLCLNVLGPLRKASRRMRNLVVCTGAFTKDIALYAIGRSTTKVVFEKYILNYGQIKKILTDQGKQF